MILAERYEEYGLKLVILDGRVEKVKNAIAFCGHRITTFVAESAHLWARIITFAKK